MNHPLPVNFFHRSMRLISVRRLDWHLHSNFADSFSDCINARRSPYDFQLGMAQTVVLGSRKEALALPDLSLVCRSDDSGTTRAALRVEKHRPCLRVLSRGVAKHGILFIALAGLHDNQYGPTDVLCSSMRLTNERKTLLVSVNCCMPVL